ncbi:MAG: hypothetical protein AAF533_28790 [Acidobacteriota bacterium]
MPRDVNELQGFIIENVAIIEEADSRLVIRAWSGLACPQHPSFRLVFDGPWTREGSDEAEDVQVRLSRTRDGTRCRCELESTSVRPTEGRAPQVEVLSAGESRIQCGELVRTVEIAIEAASIVIEEESEVRDG